MIRDLSETIHVCFRDHIIMNRITDSNRGAPVATVFCWSINNSLSNEGRAMRLSLSHCLMPVARSVSINAGYGISGTRLVVKFDGK